MSKGFIQHALWILWNIMSLFWEIIAGVLGIALKSPTHSVLEKRAKSAKSYGDWIVIARQLDELEGFQYWRLEEDPKYMNFEGLVGRIQLLTDVKKSGDASKLLRVLSTGLQRSVYGIMNPKFYKYRSGTKAIIETYNSLLVYLIRGLARDTSVESDKKYSTLLKVAHVYGSTALVFNGGTIMGPSHVGVAKALWKANLLPRLFHGGRTGAVVAALLCCKKNLKDVFDGDELNLSVFNDISVESFSRKWHRFWNEGHLMDIHTLVKFLKDNIGELTFLEAYRLTGRVLDIEYTPEISDTKSTVAPPVRLLNFLTAPNVLVYSAAAASFASTPLIFERYPLMAKDLNGRIVRYDPPVIGSVGRRPDGKIDEMERLRELFHIKCFIFSECSASRLPFIRLADRTSLIARIGHAISQEWWRFASFLISFTSFQKYVWVLFSTDDLNADDVIKIFPASSWSDIMGLFSYSARKNIQQRVLRGERKVWPSLERIREHVAPELALDDVLKELRRTNPKFCLENENPYMW